MESMYNLNGIRHVTSKEEKFELYDQFSYSSLEHYPFIIIDEASINIERDPWNVFKYPQETVVLWQWKGNYRSDFFKTSPYEIKAAVIDLCTQGVITDDRQNKFLKKAKEYGN